MTEKLEELLTVTQATAKLGLVQGELWLAMHDRRLLFEKSYGRNPIN